MKKNNAVHSKDLKDYIEGITTPIFSKILEIPQEYLSKSMAPHTQTIKKAWRPNNYRRQIDIKERGGSASTGNIPHSLNISNGKVKQSQSNKLIFIHDFEENITLQLGKRTLTAIYKQKKIAGKKIVYIIEAMRVSEITDIIKEKTKEIQERLDNALFKFARDNSLVLPFEKPIWARYEDFLRGDDYIDQLPEDLIIHGRHIKKVYGKGIEFITGKNNDEPGVKVEQYIENRALEDMAPTVCKAINDLGARFDNIGIKLIDMMDKRMKADQELLVNLQTHNRVFHKLDRLLNTKLELRPPKKIKDKILGEWLS